MALTPTGRELSESSATLIECVNDAGLKHTVLQYNASYKGNPALTTGVDLISSFISYPMVTGLVECSEIDTENLRFAYPTGAIWTIKEVLRGFDQVGQPVGARAALEMCYLAGMVLDEAGETGPLQGCFSHSNLSPRRVSLKADGQLQVFGYGLPQMEMLDFLSGASEHIDDQSILYAPPERLEAQPEQPSSDTYSLTVMAIDLITGRPLFDGLKGQKLWDAVKLAEGVQRMLAHKKVPKKIRDVLANALVYDPDMRLQGQNYVNAIGNLLDDKKLEGRTLREVMLRMRQQGTKSSRKLVKASATSAFSPADLAALAAAQAEDEEDVVLEEPGEARWGRRVTGRRTGGGSPRRRRRETDTAPRQRRREEEKPTAKRSRKTKAPVQEAAPPAQDDVDAGEPKTAETAVASPAPSVTAAREPTAKEVESSAEAAVPPRRKRKSRLKKEAEAKAAEAKADGNTSGAQEPKKADPPEPPLPAPEEADAKPAEDAAEADSSAPRRRRRRGANPESAPDPMPGRRRRTAPAEGVEETPPPRRRRRRPEGAEAAADPVPDTPRKRRRRRPTQEEDEA